MASWVTTYLTINYVKYSNFTFLINKFRSKIEDRKVHLLFFARRTELITSVPNNNLMTDSNLIKFPSVAKELNRLDSNFIRKNRIHVYSWEQACKIKEIVACEGSKK